MPILLDRMPFPDQPSEILVRDQRVRLRQNQIILWITLSLPRITSPNPLAVPFPTILDTGHTHIFSISENHLTQWTGFQSDRLSVVGAIRDRGQRILLRSANIWVFRNERGSRNRVINYTPNLLKAEGGIAIYPGIEFPRLPILGLRAIAENNLLLKIDGQRREATLWPPIKWWPFS
jgi:hypothetical protein